MGVEGAFATSVAISGSTAVVGTNAGQAYIFGRSRAGLAEEARLTGTNAEFGLAVATNGSAVAVGSEPEAAVFVFTQSGGSWTQQAELTPNGPKGGFGGSVAMSGNTMVVGGLRGSTCPCKGAAYVFTKAGSVWSQQAALTASDGAADDGFGNAVAVSGSTVLVGAPFHGSIAEGLKGTGAAYVFASSGGSWTQQAELTASDGADGDGLGTSVAISNQTALAGAPGKDQNVGAAYVFAQSGGAWSQQAELTEGTTRHMFGGAVAIDGLTAAVGASGAASSRFPPGAVYVFTGSRGNWRRSAMLRPSDQGQDAFGFAVALSGSNVIAGAPGQQGGSAYVFTDYGVPTVSHVAPASGSPAGGNTVTINGSHFVAGSSIVDFGSVASPSVTVISPNQVQAAAPASSTAGSVDVTVTTPGGTSRTSVKDLYAYGPP
jgi:hypothetical protein